MKQTHAFAQYRKNWNYFISFFLKQSRKLKKKAIYLLLLLFLLFLILNNMKIFVLTISQCIADTAYNI